VDGCPFCAAFDRELLLYENEYAMVRLSEDWSVRGHAIVISKRHVENLSELDESERRAFLETYARAEKLLLEATAADRAIILKLGLLVPHLHLHIYPIGREVDRAQLFDMIEVRVRASITPEEKAAFIDEMRRRFSEETLHNRAKVPKLRA